MSIISPNDAKYVRISEGANKAMSSEFVEGSQSTYSSWGWYHSWKYKMRLPLSAYMTELDAGDINSMLPALVLMRELNNTTIGIFSKQETDKIDDEIIELKKEVRKFLKMKKFRDEC